MRLIRGLAIATEVALVVIVVTGAAVRLTDSGLGCSDWPQCDPGSITPPLALHALIEFGNRMVTVGVGVVIAALALAVIFARPRRRDIWWLTGAIVAGYLAQAVLGGLSVLFKLDPLFVMTHFLLSMLLVWVGLVLVHRADDGRAAGAVPVVRREVVWLGRLLAVVMGWVLFMGTVVTGTGPHSGAPDAASRLPFQFLQVAQLHADSALFLTGLIVATLFVLAVAGAPRSVWRRAGWMVVMVIVQIGIGYWQYFTGLPTGVVELHVTSATILWVAILELNLGFFTAPDVPVAVSAPAGEQPVGRTRLGGREAGEVPAIPGRPR